MPDQADPDSPPAGPRPTSLRDARRLFAELNNPIEVDPHSQNPDHPPQRQGFPRIPHYNIERQIGEGGGGTVYLAYRDASDKPIALKILSARPGEASIQRAWRELDLLSQIHLPSVPRVLDYGRVEGGPFAGRLYIATDYIDGEPIDQHCRTLDTSTPRHLDTSVQLLARTADALHALHERGVIHRDIKPSNILVDPHGDPVIIDLGIATLVASDVMETLTRDGAPIGSPAFMAPEQARGDRHRISIRSDIYALGATACVILTGHTPHNLENATIHEAIHRIGTEEPRNPRTLNPNLPKPLSAILTKALSPSPQHRYDSAAAFAADLRRWLRGEPVEAGAPTPWRTMTRWISKHPIATTTAACAAIALLSLAATFIAVDFLNNRPHQIVVAPDTRQVHLLSRSGNILHSWPNEHPDPFGALMGRPQHLGGGRVLVLLTRENPSTKPQVRIFHLDDLESPHRQTSPHQELPVAEWRGDHGGGDVFGVAGVLPADVFPTVPGTELVVTHNCERFPGLIRVYDLDLNVLYEAWHPGALSPYFHWLPGPPGRLVCSASNNEGPVPGEGGEWTDRIRYWESQHPGQTFDWAAIGASGEITNNWPMVFFVIQPELHARRGVVWGRHRDPDAIVDWYRFCHPADYARLYTPKVTAARDPDQRRTHFGIHLTHRFTPTATFDRQIDGATGRFVGEPFYSDIVYKQHKDWIERFRLVNDPLTPSYHPTPPASPPGD